MQRFKQLREEYGFSQHYVANHLNLSQQAWANYESGKREPSIKILKEVAAFFDVSLDYLLGNTDIKKFPTESSRENRNDMEREYHELFALLTPDSRQELKAFLSLSPEQRKAVLALAQANRPDKE